MNQAFISMEEYIEIDTIKQFSTNFQALQLLDCVLNNLLEEIENQVKYFPDKIDIRKFRYESMDNQTILIISCINENVTPNLLDKLYSAMLTKYGTIEYVEELWYGWEPIHYVAKTANVEKLKVILKYTQEQTINSLTYFSENALHILFQYEKSGTSFGVTLHSGNETKPSNILSTEKECIVTCAKLLIESGIDINHTNFWNETAICLAVRYRYIKVIQLLLDVDYIDLDSFTESGKTIREYLKLNLYTSLPQCYVQEDPIKIRFNFLKSDAEENFVEYNTENISECVNSFDGDNEYNSCGNILQLCMRKGYLEFLQDNRSKIKCSNYDIMDSPMLTVFKSKGFTRSIIFLLDNGADPSITSRKFPSTLLEYSTVRGYYPFLAILLQHKNSKISSEDIFSVLSKLYQKKLMLTNKEFYRNCVLYLLLNKLIHLFRQNNERLNPTNKFILNNLLHQLNLEYNDVRLDNSEIICQILHLGASLTAAKTDSICLSSVGSHNYDFMILDDRNADNCDKIIAERLDPNILRSHFNDCIRRTGFHYDSIIQDDSTYNEFSILNFLANDYIKRELLCHPLIIELVRRKWLKVRWLFYSNLVYHAVLIISVYAYVMFSNFNRFYWYLSILYYFLLVFLVLKEMLQFCFLYRLNYWKDSSNILEIFTTTVCFVTILYPNIYASVFSILSSTLLFFRMLGQLPFFTKYTIILSSIKYFFQYTAFYFIQFISFALCFCLVFPFENTNDSNKLNNSSSFNAEQNSNKLNNSNLTDSNLNNPDWSDIFKSLFSTLVYFTGEFDDRVTEPRLYPMFGRILMTVFIFCMSIILNNLLVGLIVADMDDLKKGGRLYKQKKLVDFIQSTNIFAKRTYTFVKKDYMKFMVNYVNVFNNKTEKVFDDVNFNHFDDVCKNYMREIRKLRAFDKHVLTDLYASLQKNQ